jgi:diguanylate cyclase (GGDEF)-like protein
MEGGRVGEAATELPLTPPAPAPDPRRGLLVVAATSLVGLVAVAGVVHLHGAELGSLPIVVVLAAFQAANHRASGWLSDKFCTPVWQLDAAIIAAGLVLLEPAGVVVAATVGLGIGCALDRRSPIAVAMMTEASLVTTSVAGLVGSAVGSDAAPGTWRNVTAILCAVLAVQLTWELLLSSYLAIAQRVAFVPNVSAALRFGLPRAPFIGGMGYVAALAATVAPVAGLFAVPPMAAMVYVLAEHFRAERDRERAETLFRTAEAAHASIEPAQVAEALADAAASLLGARAAELRDDPPSHGELGVRLDSSEESWLVVQEPSVDADTEQLLGAVAAVGASALENAYLAEQLRHQAVHDALTGLPNSVLFSDRVAQATQLAGGRSRFVVLAIDLDAFRKVNDSLGHAAGDELLREVAKRLQEAVRPGDTVARLSSDVFVLLLPDVDSAELAGVLTEKVLGAIRRPIAVSGQEVFMTACAGLAVYPDDGEDAGQLLRNADSALHRAKDQGPDSYEIYATGMNELAHQRLARESELHQAVRRDELRVRYQPQIDLRTGRIVAVEALVRWEHPVLGMLGPNEFVPLAEESGLIVEVDTWVLRRACAQVAAWLSDGLPPVRVAVNMSARHFQSPERLIGTLRDVLSDTGIPPSLLELEVTEGLAVVEDRSAEILQRVRDLGPSISIDDFGTGYSMLARLHRFPVDRLKIDRSFVREIVSAQADAPIVAAIIAMAHSLTIETVAEGVETIEQQLYLKGRGCDVAQGFLFSHPAEAEEVARMLQRPSVGFSPTSVV